jgi:hypothetical protein
MGGSASAPAPPAFNPINEPSVAQQAFNTDVAGYNWSDADLAARQPLIPKGITNNITSAVTNLTGGTDPQVSSALDSAGLSRNLGDTEAKKAASLGRPIASMQARDRNYFNSRFTATPETQPRTAGLTSQDVARIALGNTNNQNVYNQGLFGSRINQYNSQVQQQTQNTTAGITGLASILGAGIRSPYTDPYLTSAGYGSAPAIMPAIDSGTTYNVAGG